MNPLKERLKRIKFLRKIVQTVRSVLTPREISYNELRIKLEKKDKANALKNKGLMQLHQDLAKLNHAQIAEWNSLVYCGGYYYQGYKRIGIHGIKPTEERIENYEISNYFSKEKSMLDIGSNVGFMSCYLSEFVKEIDAIELNPYLIEMGMTTAQFLNISNIKFLKADFTKYNFAKKYDIVFSLSNHFTIDGNLNMDFESYIKKIFGVMNQNGILFFESHNINGDDKDMDLKFEIASKYFTLVKYKMVKSFFPQDIDKLFAIFIKLDNPGLPKSTGFNLQVAKYKYKY